MSTWIIGIVFLVNAVMTVISIRVTAEFIVRYPEFDLPFRRKVIPTLIQMWTLVLIAWAIPVVMQ